MNAPLVECHGFNIGRWWFPPFTIGRGECVTLCLPQAARADEGRVVACLSGSEAISGLTLPVTVAVAEFVCPPSGWRRWLREPTPSEWLRKKTNLSAETIQNYVREHRMDREIPLSRYAGTPRALLGLAAALAKQPELIIFSTAGLDPSGRLEMQAVVAAHLPERAAIYLSWPYLWQGEEHHDYFSASLSIEVVSKTEIAASPQRA